MEFIDIKKGTHLSVDQMNAIYNNFQYLKEKLETSRFVVSELIDNSVDYSISPANILQKFNAVESNIQTIHTALLDIFESDEKYYKVFGWTATTGNRKAEVWRWIDWLYEAKKRACMYEILFDANDEQVFDVNDERILVLQESE